MSDRFSITRRGLFRGIGTVTLVSSCAKQQQGDSTHPATVTDATAPGELGPEPVPVAFELNGKQVTVAVEPRTTLLDALRIDLDTTGAKVVCDRGACGACTVMVDGVPRNACMMLAHDVAGRKVTTVEGLAAAGELSRLQQAFVQHDALQCGFCTSGMLVSCAALLRRSASSKRRLQATDVREAISGNLCRCGTYPHVVAAVLDASKSRGGA
jgi:aerobic-type carbon monoxide dehydrogenase small subunit (CoxS/CutS family)